MTKGHPGWGGARPGAGRKPSKSNRARDRLQRLTGKALVPAEARAAPVLNFQGIADRVRELMQERIRQRRPGVTPFTPAIHPPKAMPPKNEQMAMDSALSWAGSQWSDSAAAAGIFNGLAAEGLLFPGYPYLSELAQRSEYRVMSETIADDATRMWVDFEVTGEEDVNAGDPEESDEDPDDQARDFDPGMVEQLLNAPDDDKKKAAQKGKSDKIKALKDEMERLEVRDRFYCLSRDDGFFGRSHAYLNFGEDVATGSSELGVPIGNGRDEASKAKVSKGSFREIKIIEALWTYPMAYNATNPLLPGWYDPQIWYVMGTKIDATRLLKFVSRPVPDLLKPAYSFGGISLSQLAEPYVNIWLRTRQSVADMIHSFSVMNLGTDLNTLLQPGGAASLFARADLFNELRDNMGLFLTNKTSEEFKNISASLSGLDHLQAQAQEHMSSVSRIPLVKLTGISPSGLNASSEGEIRAYYDTISAYQNRVMRPALARIINFMQLSLWGEIDPEITFKFNPLWELSDKERGEKEKGDAERDQKYIDMGALAPAEVRGRIIDDPTLPYTSLSKDDVPDLQVEEEQGLEPQGGRDPKAGGGEEGGPSKGGAPFGQDEAPLHPALEEA